MCTDPYKPTTRRYSADEDFLYTTVVRIGGKYQTGIVQTENACVEEKQILDAWNTPSHALHEQLPAAYVAIANTNIVREL